MALKLDFEKVGATSALSKLLLWHPAIASTLLGAGIGAGISGEKRRTRGALAGALGGFTGGIFGRGLLRGLATSGRIPSSIASIIGRKPLVHQYAGGALGGLLGGAYAQPEPTPVVFSAGRTGHGLDTIERAKELLNVNEMERV